MSGLKKAQSLSNLPKELMPDLQSKIHMHFIRKSTEDFSNHKRTRPRSNKHNNTDVSTAKKQFLAVESVERKNRTQKI
jgi:hypothetical protein